MFWSLDRENSNPNFFIRSMNQQSPRKELLHNIDLLYPPIGKRLYPDSYDNRFRAAIRVGDMKLLTGSVGKILRRKKCATCFTAKKVIGVLINSVFCA